MVGNRPFIKSSSFKLLLAVALGASLLFLALAGPAQAQTETGISITGTASPNPATVGQPLTFTLTVTNESATQNVGLKDFLPSRTTFVSATPSQGMCANGHEGEIACELGEVPSGSSATVEVVVTPTAPGTITNTANAGGERTVENSTSTTVEVNS
jgi:uncharacterized repeat protein (TIGR01451 family)